MKWDEMAILGGKRVWDLARQNYDGDLYRATCRLWWDERSQHTDEEIGSYDLINVRHLHSLGIWAESGYPKLLTTHKYAAAMMSTDITRDSYEDIEIPWQAVVLVIPDGLITYPDGGIPITRVVFAFHKAANDGTPYGSAGVYISLCRGDTHDRKMGFWVAGNVADGLFSEDVLQEFNERVRPLIIVVRRLLVGLLWTMQYTDNWKPTSPTKSANNPIKRGPPAHRVVMVGRPIDVDCRKAVQTYIAGHSDQHTPPSVQTLVRGHYKRQVIGVARSGRKVIWVEPYWRGPEAAPILARPYKIGKDL